MSNFNVDTDGLRSAAGICDGISGNISNLGDQINDVRASLYGTIGKYSGVMSALNTCYSNAKRCSTKVNQYGNVGMRIANEYANTENTISGKMKLDKFGNITSGNRIAQASVISDIFDGSWLPKIISIVQFAIPISALYFRYLFGLGALNAEEIVPNDVINAKIKLRKNEGTKYKWDLQKKKFIEEKSKDGKEKNPLKKEYSLIDHEWDSKNKKWVESEKEAKKKGFAGMEKEVTIHKWKASTPSGEFWGGKGTLQGKYGKLEGSVDVSKWETEASGYVGLLAAGGTLGASYTAFNAEGLAQLGSDDFGGYLKGTVTVGKIEGKATGSVGLFDKYGNFKPNAMAEASLEAIAGEISGKAGIKVAGIDAGLTGSLNYGIGAHAKVGYSDGKLSVDIGATLGVGGSVKLDIDVSGAVNAVCGEAKAVWDGFKGLFGH
ncbi:hypothetical protein [Oribacterium sp. NK2B42]|uniref:hypothetical protein n=1 Tax=Oribacterium sp. NK2B42 TaxID=689781 RepID=UPI00042234EF|nr:hypothetical protein [Oribacterium sp. NK2B42]